MKRRRRGRLLATVAGAASAILLIGTFALLLWQSGRDSPGAEMPPRLTVPALERDFGAVAEGTLLKHAFELQNVGGRRAIIRELGCSSCGEVDAESLVVAPGESAWIELVVPTLGVQGALRYVRHYWTSDPGQPRLQLTLMAEVEPNGQGAPTLAAPLR